MKSNENEPFSFVVFGDAHAGSVDSRYGEIVERIAAVEPDFVVAAGDLTENGREQAHWDTFFEVNKPLSDKAIPIYPVFGNHDQVLPDPFFLTFFQPPANKLWYSFDYREAHFVMLYCPQGKGDIEEGDEQYNWLIADLQKASESGRLIFVVQHCCCFSSTTVLGPSGKVPVLPELLAASEGIVMNFSGHSHAYERSIFPDRDNGTHFVTTAGAGILFPEKPVDVVPNPWQVTAANIRHFVKVTVNPAVSVTVDAITIDGTCYESFSVAL